MPASYALDSFPGQRVQLFLFQDVKNSAELLDKIKGGTFDPECSFIRADLVPGVFPVLAAAHKALTGVISGTAKTKTLHSELVFCYSGSTHIREGLSRCSISADTESILVARFNCTEDEATVIQKLVLGREVDLNCLSETADTARIKKHFKLLDEETKCGTLDDALVTKIAVREFL